MELIHDRIKLRNAAVQDAAQLAAWWNDGAVMAHAGFPNGLGTTAEKVAAQIAGDSDEGGRRLMIEYGGEPIGEMSYRNRGGQTAEIGIKICEEVYREKGIGRIALSMLIGELFAVGFQRIVLDTDPDNRRARHVYELLGFRLTGIRQECWTDQLGRLRSAADYELTRAAFVDFSQG